MPPLRLIEFDLRPFRGEGSARELMPIVDGSPLTEYVSSFEVASSFEPAGLYAGLVLDYYRFGDLASYLMGEQTPWPAERVQLLGCECGEWGCWPFLAGVRSVGGRVQWSDFEQPHRRARDYRSFGPFVFEEKAYRRAVSKVADQFEPGAGATGGK